MAKQVEQTHGGAIKVREKGDPGLPGAGRPKKIPEIETLLADVLNQEQGGVSAAQAILLSMLKQAVKGNTQAAKILLERAYGMPKQPIEHSGKDGEPLAPTVIKVEYRKPDADAISET